MKRLLLLAALLGCGSKENFRYAPAAAVAARGLDYTDPTDAGWRLVRHPSSKANRLVLELHGPAGEMTRGVGFNLKAGPGVKFGSFPTGMAIEDGGVYTLNQQGSFDANEPLAIVGGVLPGGLLSVGVYQKDRAWPARDSGAALLRVAVEFDPKAELVAGTPIEIGVVKAKVIPEEIGSVSDDPYVLQSKLRMRDITIAMGRVVAL